MPGTFHTKRSNKVFPPDWNEIGYEDTPISTINGFNYAKDILDNWDLTTTSHTEEFRGNKQIMYFPSNIDSSNLIVVDRMFQDSNIEYIELDLSNARTATSVFADCKNLRYAKITGVGNPEAPSGHTTNISNMFINCQGLEEVDIDFTEYNSDLNINNLFNACYSLKSFSYDGIIDNVNRITSATNTFTNCYKLESLIFKDTKTSDLGCYSIGSNTNDGCFVNIEIGSMNNNYKTHADFRNAKIKSNYPDALSLITINNNDSAQSLFEGATGDVQTIIYCDGTLNCSFMYKNYNYINATNLSIDIIDGINNNVVTGIAPGAFNGCKNTIIIINSQPNNNTIWKPTTANEMFANSDVVSINGINTKLSFELCTNFTNMFYNTPNIDDNTLNNILLTLANNTVYTGTKTLATLGLDSVNYPANRIQALSNYNIFTIAGWAIGY